MANETACPAPDDDPDPDKPHVFKAYPNGYDPQDPIVAVQRYLLEDEPKIKRRKDNELAGLTENEARTLGRSDAQGNKGIASWLAHADAARCNFRSLQRNLLADIKVLSDWISVLPNTVVVYETGSWIGDVGAELLKKSRYFVPVGVGLASLVIGSVLGIEMIANSGALQGSGLDFVIKQRDALSHAFGMTIGAFLLLNVWSAAEKYEVHESIRSVLREGKLLFDLGFPLVGIGIGAQLLDEGQSLGWPMVIVPFSMQILVRAAFGLEGWLLRIAGLLVPPTIEEDNEAKKERIAERRNLQSDLDEVEKKIALAQQLLSRAERVIATNEMLVIGRWRGLQKVQQNIDDARRDDLGAIVAKAKKEQADEVVKRDSEAT